ncbi:MAG: vWA domain-containing protein [Bradymonadaceae bacterium]
MISAFPYRTGSVALVALCLCSLALGCTQENPAYNPDPLLPGECRAGIEVSETFASFERPEQLDMLIVVDNSGRVTELQKSLARALMPMLDVLEEEELDVRVGVMTMDSTVEIGLAPASSRGDGCESNTTQVANSAQRNWKSIVSCNVQQGDGGDAFQRSMEVIYRSVVSEPESLSRFRRESARLLILVLTNEDDCSAREAFPVSGDVSPRNACVWNQDKLIDVGDWSRAIRGEATTPEGISLAVISGPPSSRVYEHGEAVRPVCEGGIDTGGAYASNRLYDATAAFGASGRFYSVCVNELDRQMMELGRELAITSTTTLCPGQKLAHEPLAVDALDEDEKERSVPLGEHGFMFLGRSAECETGALQFNADALRDAQAVTTMYCVVP